MTRRRSRTVGGLLAALVACPLAGAAPATPMDTTSELIRLADVVSFLRRRVLAERPELLADRDGQAAAFRSELARLDLDPPEGVLLDVRIDDLNLAGLLLEEQLRRRRSARRGALLAETTAAFEVPSASDAAPSSRGLEGAVVPEVARLFSAIQDDRDRVPPLPGPHPAGGFPQGEDAAAPPADDLSLADELAAVGAKLRAALARVDSAAPATEDPDYGDRSQRVSGAASEAEPTSDEAFEGARVLPPPVAREPDLDTRKTAVVASPAAIAAKKAPSSVPAPVPAKPAGLPREHGVAAVLAQVLSLVQGQGVSASEFPTVMSATLATFGVQVPGEFRPRPEDSPEAMARELLATSGGAVDVSMAAAALGI